MKIKILTLFPEMFSGFLSESIIGRAQKSGALKIKPINLRDWGQGPRKQVDDSPYGGGAGMVLKVDIIVKAISDIKEKNSKIILMSPQGQPFNQKKAKELAQENKDLVLFVAIYT